MYKKNVIPVKAGHGPLHGGIYTNKEVDPGSESGMTVSAWWNNFSLRG